MSGDVQPRKRKDKKKKKDESDEGVSVPGKASPPLGEGDAYIHVHHEGGTGGHWCAKIIFFSLLGVMLFLIGLIIIENRGLTDLDVPASESKYAQMFDGWVDDSPIHDDHHDEHTLELNHEVEHSQEDEHDDDEHNDEEIENLEDEHGHTDYEQSDGEDEGVSDNEEDDGDKEEQSEEYLEHNEEQHDDDNEDTAEEDEEQQYEIDFNGDANQDDENDDDVDDEYLEHDDFAEDSKAVDSNEADDEKPFEEIDSKEEDVIDNSEVEEELLAAKKAEELLAQEQEDSGVGMRVGIGLALVMVAYCVLARKFNNASDGEAEDNEGADLNRRMTLIDDEDEEIEQPPPIKRIVPPVTRSPPLQPIQPPKQPEQPKAPAPLSAEATRIRQIIHRYIEDEDEEDIKPQEPVKETIAEVEVKKSTPVVESQPKESTTVKQQSQEEEDEEDVEEITKEEIENIEYEDDQEIVEEEEIDEEIEEEEEIIEEEEEEEDISDDDDSELLKKLEEKYGKLPQQDDDEAEGQSDGERPPVTPARKKGKSGGGNSVEDGEPEQWPEEEEASDHWKEQLELAQAEMDEGDLDNAYRLFTALTMTNKTCPLAKLGRAKALDSLAETKRSNDLLDRCIEAYKEILEMKNLTDDIFLEVTSRAIKRMRFRGKHNEAVPIHYMLVTRYPDNVSHRNDLAVTYLMVNKVKMARTILNDTISRWPNDGIALVHYGFILKTEDNNLVDGVKYMQRGVDTGEEGTLDGRFLFHLGDAYARLGNDKKAHEIYELGTLRGVFLSPVQRSLYNVNRLTGRPWWEPEQTPYGKLFQELENNWKLIAAEAKKLYSVYEPERENLKDKGDWTQFQMFARGREVNNNCLKCPVTCSIVKKEVSAWNCRRGQVKFSAMQPGTHVFAHTGPTNCRLRAHLGLSGTEGTYIRVANETRSWKEGQMFIFDDSFEHEVWHNGTQLRIVLIVDLWHPELTREERMSLPSI